MEVSEGSQAHARARSERFRASRIASFQISPTLATALSYTKTPIIRWHIWPACLSCGASPHSHTSEVARSFCRRLLSTGAFSIACGPRTHHKLSRTRTSALPTYPADRLLLTGFPSLAGNYAFEREIFPLPFVEDDSDQMCNN